jgi:hypothetical protein
MNYFFRALSALPSVAGSPLALIGLIVLTLAATFLFWKQSSYKSLAKTLAILPENDRLERIRLHYGVRPKSGVSASAWLTSRRHDLLFWGYVSTLLVALLGFLVIYGEVTSIPGGTHRTELLASFASFHDNLAAHELAARNLRDAFALAGENAIDPDPQTDALLSERIARYNSSYSTLRKHQEQYTTAVLRWLEARPDLAREVRGVMDYALNEVHQGGLLRFNEAAYRRAQQIEALRSAASGEINPAEVRVIRMEGAIEIQALARDVTGLLDVFARRLQTLRAKIVGDG